MTPFLEKMTISYQETVANGMVNFPSNDDSQGVYRNTFSTFSEILDEDIEL